MRLRVVEKPWMQKNARFAVEFGIESDGGVVVSWGSEAEFADEEAAKRYMALRASGPRVIATSSGDSAESAETQPSPP